MKKREWEFAAGSEDLHAMEHAEKVFLRTPQDGYTRAEFYETKLQRRNGLWQFYFREAIA